MRDNSGRFISRPALERFLAKVVIDASGCWLWTAAISAEGYGLFRVGDRQVMAHRWAYEHWIGPIPDGLPLDHVKDRGCLHRNCVNPEHLEPVTVRENVLRSDGPCAVNARKTHCVRGHLLAGDNLLSGVAGRICRPCRNERSRERGRQKRLERGATPGRGGHHAIKTHCPKGHPYDEENTYWRTPTHRGCRACKRESNREQKIRKRLAAASDGSTPRR